MPHDSFEAKIDMDLHGQQEHIVYYGFVKLYMLQDVCPSIHTT